MTRLHTIEVTDRELAAILAAFFIARDQTVNAGWNWWHNTKYAESLYLRLQDLPNEKGK